MYYYNLISASVRAAAACDCIRFAADRLLDSSVTSKNIEQRTHAFKRFTSLTGQTGQLTDNADNQTIMTQFSEHSTGELTIKK